jgi:hypothetical protein
MSYCALDEAFLGPPAGAEVKRHKKVRPKEVPPPLPDVPNSSEKIKDELMLSPPTGTGTGPVNRLKAQESDSFFPLPGPNETESWEKAFMMDSDFTKTLSQPVAGEPTLWRQIQPAPPQPEAVAKGQGQPTTVWSDMNARLDTLTKQLESLTSTANSQSTAELFLFVAIGLLLLLFVDTLMRYATTIKSQSQIGGYRSYQSGGFRRLARDSFGRFRRY